jgi:hypothetical protein
MVMCSTLKGEDFYNLISKLAIPSTIPIPLPPSIFNHCYEFIELVLVLHAVHQVIHIDFAKYLQIF